MRICITGLHAAAGKLRTTTMGGNTVSNWQVKDDTGPSVKVLELTMQTRGKSLRPVSDAVVTGELKALA